MKKILVTGGAGFIGSAFVRLAIKKGLNISIVDKLTYAGDLERIKDLYEKLNFYKTDIANKKELESAFLKECPNIIVHFAAESHVDRSIINPSEFILTNVVGTVNLLGLAFKHKVEKFIHISTDEVYGELPDNNKKFVESDPVLPNSPEWYKNNKEWLLKKKTEVEGFVKELKLAYKKTPIHIAAYNVSLSCTSTRP